MQTYLRRTLPTHDFPHFQRFALPGGPSAEERGAMSSDRQPTDRGGSSKRYKPNSQALKRFRRELEESERVGALRVRKRGDPMLDRSLEQYPPDDDEKE